MHAHTYAHTHTHTHTHVKHTHTCIYAYACTDATDSNTVTQWYLSVVLYLKNYKFFKADFYNGSYFIQHNDKIIVSIVYVCGCFFFSFLFWRVWLCKHLFFSDNPDWQLSIKSLCVCVYSSGNQDSARYNCCERC